jgi:beta-galactosidase
MILKSPACLVPALILCVWVLAGKSLAADTPELIASSNADPAAPVRSRVPLVEWQFTEEASPVTDGAVAPPAESNWKPVTVPHVFRQSGLPDDTAGWYRRTLHPEEADHGKRFYLVLEGAASVKDVFVNGRHIGQHKGAFSQACFDLTPELEFGQDNTLDVRVSNRTSEARNCFSRSTLYYVNGGMFRPAWLVKTGAVHIFPDMGSSGVYLTPKNITATSADLEIRAVIRNTLSRPANVKVRYTVKDPKGVACGEFSKSQTIPVGETATVETVNRIANPQLWDLGRPNLYRVHTEVSVDGTVMDELDERTGFRTLVWKDGRFFLNGREVQFRGVNKHAQNETEWNAVGDAELRQEWQWMADMGANTVRLAHYPHRALEYDIADERGMAVWAENGYAGQIWKGAGNEEKTVTPDGERLTREMVRQNWNHPSILFWSAGNETILNVVSHYAMVIRQENDPNRLVTYAANAGSPENCDFVAMNTYDGWYGDWGNYSDFARLPANALVSETGSGDWITHHVPYGTFKWTVDKFEPEEYSEIFTEYRLQTVCRDDVARRPMFLWWTFREFYNLKFKGNRNTKGLLTLAGAPKDAYFLFQAFFNPARPVLHLCGRQHFFRAFAPDNGIKVYSNSDEVRLTLNGVPQEKIRNGSYRLPDSVNKRKDGAATPVPGIPVANVFFWKTPLRPGRNVIEVADDRGLTDRMVIYQKPVGAVLPDDRRALVQELESSNADNPAWFIDRPVEAQGAFYTDVDGSSDNTFDVLPKEIEGASWIATRRLSDPGLKTDLSFRINPSSPGATVFVLFSTGNYPTVTLKPSDPAVISGATAMRASLKTAGFKAVDTDAVWRDHALNRAQAELWTRVVRPGEKVSIPGHTLDYVILLRPPGKAAAPSH